jgi:hypothetical protein
VLYLRTDQYTHISRDCPVCVDLHSADDVVEITLGEHRIGGDTLRLVVDHPDTFLRLAEALQDAHSSLIKHLHAKANPDPALTQLDRVRNAVNNSIVGGGQSMVTVTSQPG